MDLEVELDRFLKIKTNGRDDSNSNFINYPYEATPYSVLQVLANSEHMSKKDKIIDFGCGKGRVSFYLSYSRKVRMIGVEYDERLYNAALENKKKCISASKVEFIYSNACDYEIEDDSTAAYFFNPFNVDILKSVISNIKKSITKQNREFKLFFYYPSKEYLEYLESECDMVFIENIECYDLFNEYDSREYIKVYRIGGCKY